MCWTGALALHIDGDRLSDFQIGLMAPRERVTRLSTPVPHTYASAVCTPHSAPRHYPLPSSHCSNDVAALSSGVIWLGWTLTSSAVRSTWVISDGARHHLNAPLLELHPCMLRFAS